MLGGGGAGGNEANEDVAAPSKAAATTAATRTAPPKANTNGNAVSSSGDAVVKQRESMSELSRSGSSVLPLSMRVMRRLPGSHCSCCGVNGGSNHRGTTSFASSWRPGESEDEDDDEDFNLSSEHNILAGYDLQALRRQNSSISPLLLAPMTSSSSRQVSDINQTKNAARIIERIISEYSAACRFYGCGDRINAGVLTTFRFSLPCLRVSGGFHDADMLALCEILMRYSNGPLRYLRRLDFTVAAKEGRLSITSKQRGFRSHGAFALAKVLQGTQYVEEVYLQGNRIGPYGASAIFVACSTNPTIRKLNLRRCRVGERGALAFAELILTPPVDDASGARCGLREVDLSANYIGFKGSIAIERALAERRGGNNRGKPIGGDGVPATFDEEDTIVIDLEGNLVLQEVMNGVTHGLGVLLAFLGSYLLSFRVRDLSHRHTLSCMVYSSSLVVLYMSSTLYHSFFTMQHTKYIFEVMDKCAIYILIAGSYTPFLQIVLWHEPLYSVYLLTFLWVCCVLGICVEAFLPSWRGKGKFSLAMYLGMGWSSVVCLPEVARVIPEGALNLMILGGVGYTAGVPFFVRDNNLDHAVWHLFVLAGSVFHWCGIYFYVAPLP